MGAHASNLRRSKINSDSDSKVHMQQRFTYYRQADGKLKWSQPMFGALHEIQAVLADATDADLVSKIEDNDERGLTLLMNSIEGHHWAAFKMLLKCASLDVNYASRSQGATALLIACTGGHERYLGSLLKSGADPHLAMKAGASPLYMAAQEGHLDCVQILLEHGADPQQTMSAGATPLFIAAQEVGKVMP